MRRGGKFGLLAEPSFRLLWLGRTTSELGSALVPVALAFAVVDLTRSASALGLVLASGFASRLALLLLGGVVADRLPRRQVMLAADALRAVTQGSIAALLYTGDAQVWSLALLVGLYGAGDAFFSPASTGLVADTARPGHLQQANALLSLSRSGSAIAGPALAGLLVATAGAGTAFALDAATFVASGISLALLRVPRAEPRAKATVLADLREGWRELTKRSWVWWSIAYFSVSNLAIAPLYVLGPVVAADSFGGPEAWGLIVTCAGAGAAIGDVAAARVRPRRLLTPGYLLVATWALAPALLARPFQLPLVAAAAALGLAALSFSNALWFTALQEQIPRQVLSRLSAYDWLGSRAFQPLGYAVAGPAAAAIGIPATLVAGAAVHASASVAVALLPSVRGVRRVEPPLP